MHCTSFTGILVVDYIIEVGEISVHKLPISRQRAEQTDAQQGQTRRSDFHDFWSDIHRSSWAAERDRGSVCEGRWRKKKRKKRKTTTNKERGGKVAEDRRRDCLTHTARFFSRLHSAAVICWRTGAERRARLAATHRHDGHLKQREVPHLHTPSQRRAALRGTGGGACQSNTPVPAKERHSSKCPKISRITELKRQKYK